MPIGYLAAYGRDCLQIRLPSWYSPYVYSYIEGMILMANSIDKLRDGQPDGIGNKSNLKDWADYAKGNSFDQRQSKAQSKHDLDASNTKGGESDETGLWEQPQRQAEGKGWTD